MRPPLTLIAIGLSALLATGCDVGSIDPGGDLGADGGVAPNEPEPPDAGFVASCGSCHGDPDNPAPPKDLDGNTDRSAPGVGAHRQHLAGSTWRAATTCVDCHAVPETVDAPGHLDGDNVAEQTFGLRNPEATYDPATNRCDNLYCHGNGWNSLGSATWTDQQPLDCESCHESGGQGGATMSGDHRRHLGEGVDCADCHSRVVDGARTVIGPALHVDGARDVVFAEGGTWDPAQQRCTNLACHGSEGW
jgi:predicted CxxxxCH...CXXCH cytochrome family protein